MVNSSRPCLEARDGPCLEACDELNATHVTPFGMGKRSETHHPLVKMNDRNFFGSRRESLKPGSISRLRTNCQELDSESNKRKAASIRHFGRRLSDNEQRLSDKESLCQLHLGLQTELHSCLPVAVREFEFGQLSFDLPRYVSLSTCRIGGNFFYRRS